MASSRVTLAAIAAVLVAFAADLRADEAKTYRWVGEDGHIYSGPNPPPNGRGVIESPAATPKAAPAPSQPAAKPAVTPAEPRPSPRASSAPNDCKRWNNWLAARLYAKQRVAAIEQDIDRLNSDTDNYVQRNDSAHNAQVDGATASLKAAEDELDRIESDAIAAGVPQGCLND